MSYRELRNFVEALRELHYSRVVSLENFRQPNFALVAELLFFLLHKAAPDADARLPRSIDEEEDRVAFVSACCRLAFQSVGVALNPLRLYSADGRSVRELLKLATYLQCAQRISLEKAEQLRASSDGKVDDEAIDEYMSTDHRVARSQALSTIGNVRELSNQVTRAGAALNDLLDDEKDISVQRAVSVAFLERLGVGGGPGAARGFRHTSPEEQFLQRSLQELVQSMETQIRDKMEELQELQSEDQTLTAKIERRCGELERAEKRLRALASVRPQFMDEYEAIEEQMQILYEQYVIKIRNIAALEQQLHDFEEQEKQHMYGAERRRAGLQKVMKEQEQKIFAATHEFAGDSYEIEDAEVVDYAVVEQRSYGGKSADDSNNAGPALSHQISERAIRQNSGGTFQTSPISDDGSGDDDDDDDDDGDLSAESFGSSDSDSEASSDGVSQDGSEATPEPQGRSATRMAEYSQSDNDDASSDRISTESDDDF